MGSRSFRHSLAITASAALLLAGLAVPADADRFAASAGRVDDPTGDALGTRPVPVHEPRADLTAARAVLGGDGRIELTATVASPTDPATDPGWNDGKSYLMWGLDTTADGTPDYVVWMASGPPLEAIVLTSRMGAVDGCNPVAAYSPARYSVTISGACIGSPGTFRWNAVVYYDVSHNNDGNGATDNLVGERRRDPGARNRERPHRRRDLQTGRQRPPGRHHLRHHRLRTWTDRPHRHPRPPHRPAAPTRSGSKGLRSPGLSTPTATTTTTTSPPSAPVRT